MLVLAKKCDRCGTYYNCYHGKFAGVARGVNGIVLADIDNNAEAYYERKYIDLCPRCLTDFQSWITKILERSTTNVE